MQLIQQEKANNLDSTLLNVHGLGQGPSVCQRVATCGIHLHHTHTRVARQGAIPRRRPPPAPGEDGSRIVFAHTFNDLLPSSPLP